MQAHDPHSIGYVWPTLSILSGLLVAATMVTSCSASTPSISVSSWANTRSATSPPPPPWLSPQSTTWTKSLKQLFFNHQTKVAYLEGYGYSMTNYIINHMHLGIHLSVEILHAHCMNFIWKSYLLAMWFYSIHMWLDTSHKQFSSLQHLLAQWIFLCFSLAIEFPQT